MKKTIPLVIALLLLISVSPAFAETKTFIKEYAYQASDFDSKISSRTIALEQVKRLLLEEVELDVVSLDPAAAGGSKAEERCNQDHPGAHVGHVRDPWPARRFFIMIARARARRGGCGRLGNARGALSPSSLSTKHASLRRLSRIGYRVTS